MGDGCGVAVVSAGHVGITRSLGIVFNAADVLWMSEVRGMRGVGVVSEMCICLVRNGVGGVGGEWMRALGLGFTNPVCRSRGRVGHVSVFWLRWCGWCM